MRAVIWTLSIGLLAGCPKDDDEPLPTHTTTPPDDPWVYGVEVGQAPWDPIVVGWEQGIAEPIVERADGTEVTLEPAPLHGGGQWAWRAPEPGLPPGEYTVTGLVDPTLELPEGPVPWTVEPIGTEPGFDPGLLQGVTFEAQLQGADLAWPLGLGELLVDQIAEGGVWLEILDVTGDGVLFRLIGDVGGLADVGACEVLRARGELSDTGRLTWSQDVLDLVMDDEDTELALRQLAFQVGFSADGQIAAGGAASGLFDADQLFDLLVEGADPESLCALAGGCADCVDLDVPSGRCGEVQLAAVELLPTDTVFADPMPLCGIDIDGGALTVPDITIAPISCDLDLEIPDIDCGCSVGLQGGLPAGWVLLITLLRRRRATG